MAWVTGSPGRPAWPALLLLTALSAGPGTAAAGHALPPARFAGRGVLGPLQPLGGLYLGFVGRLVLTDFRDVRGDALVGKRTFLVRRGRVAAARLSAEMWLAAGVAVTFAGLAAVGPGLSVRPLPAPPAPPARRRRPSGARS